MGYMDPLNRQGDTAVLKFDTVIGDIGLKGISDMQQVYF